MPQKVNTFLRKLLDLREGSEEKDIIIENVKDDSDFSSARFWTLVFAIGLASVGLNINSVPVVIGAMLISPLMGPVVSMGLALAINDWGLMRRSLRNLSILVFISVVISAIYFALSPITNAQSELLARTQPTIFDVLIAIFGGAVGFIGVSRERFNNIIPGVAIATALIPPLCTVGYGIGTLQIEFIFGAFYLFLINCIFICLSSLLVAKYLKLPKVKYTSETHQKKVRRIIATIIIVIVTPAIFLAVTFVKQNNFYQNADNFIKTSFLDRGHVIIYKNLSFTPKEQTIEVAFLDDIFSDERIEEIKSRLADFNLKGTSLVIRQNSQALTEAELRDLLTEVQTNDEKILTLEALLKSEQQSANNPAKILEEAKFVNSSIKDIALGSLEYGEVAAEGQASDKVVFVYLNTEDRTVTPSESEVVSGWLKKRLNDNSLIIYFIPPTQELPEEGSSKELI